MCLGGIPTFPITLISQWSFDALRCIEKYVKQLSHKVLSRKRCSTKTYFLPTDSHHYPRILNDIYNFDVRQIGILLYAFVSHQVLFWILFCQWCHLKYFTYCMHLHIQYHSTWVDNECRICTPY